MVETPEQNDLSVPTPHKKGCSITLMFPVETDEEALIVKKAIDAVLPDVEGKRYTFQIAEM